MKNKTLFVVVFLIIIFGSGLLIKRYFFREIPKVEEIAVVIPEGKTVGEIDSLLSDLGVISPKSLINYEEPLEGFLFPDTYRFYASSSAEVVVNRFLENFKLKAEPLLMTDKENFTRNLILASIIEKEVPDSEERKIVAGILLKRLKNNMPLQVDVTLCYLKQLETMGGFKNCYPIMALDKKINSPYNTYIHLGVPPAPISNPGIDAIQAILEPEESPYLYYLSDPETKKTVFSKTLDEHNKNRVKYLNLNL